MSKHIPYFDFYPADFMNGVRGLSAQEVGVYTMILCRIYEENGPIEFHINRLSTYCGMRPASFEKVITKLVDLGKFNLSEGMLSNRRAEAEIQNRANKLKINSKAGKESSKKRQQKQSTDSTDVQRTFNHTDTDTDTDTEATLNSVAEPPPQDDLDSLQSKLLSAIGEENIQGHGAFNLSPILGLISAGVSVDIDIIPTLKARCPRMKSPARSWAFFTDAIREAYEGRVSAGKGLTPPPQIGQSDEDWQRRLKFARLKLTWSSAEWGPMPWQQGCRVPSHLLQPGDGAGWADQTQTEPRRSVA